MNLLAQLALSYLLFLHFITYFCPNWNMDTLAMQGGAQGETHTLIIRSVFLAEKQSQTCVGCSFTEH